MKLNNEYELYYRVAKTKLLPNNIFFSLGDVLIYLLLRCSIVTNVIDNIERVIELSDCNNIEVDVDIVGFNEIQNVRIRYCH